MSMFCGASAFISFSNRSGIPVNIEVPPDMTVFVQVSSNINVALHDGGEAKSVESGAFHAKEVWLEENFCAAESFVPDGNGITVGKFVLLFHVAGSFGFCHLFVEINSAVAKLF